MVDPASTPEHLNQETDAMSTGNGEVGEVLLSMTATSATLLAFAGA